jgi:phosphoglycerol transferase MdoB-like AlkP superfamily enzyme
MAAGWGWICGNFVQPVATSYGGYVDALHFLPFVALLLLSLSFFSALIEGKQAKGSRIGISIVAAFGILTCAVFILLGASNPDPNSVGVHNFEDTMPVIVLSAGNLLWFASLLFVRRGSHAMVTTSEKQVEVAR